MSFLVDDPELQRRFRAGDAAAMEAVYRHYLPLVAEIVRKGFTFVSDGRQMHYRGTSSDFEVDDLIADVFARAFRDAAREAYDGLRPYAAYLKTIARNTIIERLRSRNPLDSGLTELLDDCGAELGADPGASPFEQLEHCEVVKLAASYVAGLAPVERAILEGRYVAGKTQAELAAELNMSVPTLRKRQRRLVRVFFAYMKSQGYFEHRRWSKKLGGLLAGLLVLGVVLHGRLS